jgi:hypothetical protein
VPHLGNTSNEQTVARSYQAERHLRPSRYMSINVIGINPHFFNLENLYE